MLALKFAEGRGKYTGIWWGHLEEREHLGDIGIDGKIIIKWIIKAGGGVLNMVTNLWAVLTAQISLSIMILLSRFDWLVHLFVKFASFKLEGK